MTNIDPGSIAIVGVGCRFPGAQNLEEFWRVLEGGENHVIEVPKDRWNVDAYFDADPDAPGKTYVKKVGIVKEHDMFDNRLFDINNIEASKMDPQQRFLLESTFMALENGGIPRGVISGSNTGVYIGVMNKDYTDILAADMNQVDNYTLTGGSASIAAARISYVFNLLGPAMAIDTACSSSLIAINVASQALVLGDCNMAICGGVNCVMLPSIMIPLSKARMVSPTGASRAFSAEADGYARGEGSGIVVLKRLADAITNGDNIWATIKTASNQDGRMASPITAPSGQQQEALLRETYARCGVNARDVQYIEAHGTGTPLGDPIEVTSLGNFFSEDGCQRYIGSVKTNIGHLESAAGIAGLIKVLLMMKNSTIAPSLHFTNPNPKIDFSKFNFVVPIKRQAWDPLPDGRKVACVNSFGFGGSNSHAVVIQHTSSDTHRCETANRHAIIAISGHSKKALQGNVSYLMNSLSDVEVDINLLSYTSTCRRDHYTHRVAVSAADVKDLLHQLGKHSLANTGRKNVRLIFVFGGMGTHWTGMCKDLMQDSESFREGIRSVDNSLKQFTSISIEEELESQENIDDVLVGPLLLFSCQIGLVHMWTEWGVEPSAVVGQSVGEVAAAFASGRLSLDDAVKIIFYRTKFLASVKGGQMLAILSCDVSDVEEVCKQHDDKVNIAVYYSPTSCSVSGEEESVQAVRRTLELEYKEKHPNLSIIALNVSTAYHSKKVAPVADLLKEKIEDVKPCKEKCEIHSSVTGEVASSEDFITPDYWANNLREPVLFYQALKSSQDKDKYTVYVEIGPKPVLQAHIDSVFQSAEVLVIPSMRKGSGLQCMINSLCQLFSLGVTPAWESIVPQYHGTLADEPKYQFKKSKMLYEPDISRMARDGTIGVMYNHPFVYKAPGEKPTFKIHIDEQKTPFIFEHIVNGVILVPGAFYAEAALRVGSEVLLVAPQTLTIGVHYVHPLSLQRGQRITLTCQVRILSSSSLIFTVFKDKAVYAHGEVKKRTERPMDMASVLTKIKARCQSVNEKEKIYDLLSSRGFCYGEDLSIVSQSFSNQIENLSSIVTSDLINTQIYQTHFHPCVLDAMTQALCTIGQTEVPASSFTGKLLPAGIKTFSVYRSLEKNMLSYGKLVDISESKIVYDMTLMTTDGTVIAEVKDMKVNMVGKTLNEVNRVAYSMNWSLEHQKIRNLDLDEEAILMVHDDLIFEDIFSKSGVTTHTVPCFGKINHDDMNQIRAYISRTKSKSLNMGGKCDKIVFATGVQCTKDQCSPNKIFEYISQTCDNFRQLIILLSEIDIPVTVSVLTRSTQAVPDSDGVNHQTNIVGSQLWGMVRCVLKESYPITVQLIDITDEDKESVHAVIENVLDVEKIAFVGKEIIISHGKVFTSSLQFSRETPASTLSVEQEWNGTDTVKLIKTPSGSYFRYPFYLQRLENSKSLIEGQSEIALQKVLRHTTAFSPLTVEDEVEVLHDMVGTKAAVVCLEAQGIDTRTKSPVVVCLRMQVTNIVSVPSECIVPLHVFPTYHIGLVTLLILTWKIHEITRKRKHTFIVVDESSATQGTGIQRILLLFGSRRVECIHRKNLTNIQMTGTCSLLLLTDLHFRAVESLVKSPVLLDILAFKGYPGGATLASCFAFENIVNIAYIDPGDLFKLQYIRKSLPKILSVISKKKRKNTPFWEFITPSHFEIFFEDTFELFRGCDLKLLTDRKRLFTKNSSYLVVGGLGGLGWVNVSLVAEMGGGLIAIISRNPPSDEMQALIRELKGSTGVEVICLKADVCDELSISEAIRYISTNFPKFPLKGIFHAAGILDDGLIVRMSKESFDQVCKPKILGTYNLHKVTESLHLDYFVMHSSVASIAGNGGQSNYGAGNSFMDSFAYYRRSKGLSGTSINWGPLEVGMTLHNEQIAQQLQRAGFVSLNTEQIKNCLLHSLLSNLSQVCFMDFDWIEKQRHMYLTPDIRPIIITGGKDPWEEESKSYNIDLDMLKSLARTDRLTALFSYLREVIGQVLNTDTDEITADTSLASLGMDSMLAMTLSNQINKDLSLRLSLVTLLEATTTENLNIQIESLIMSTSSISFTATQNTTKKEISVYEAMAYGWYKAWQGERDVIFGAEIYLTLPVPIEWITDMIKELLSRHTALCTLYPEEGNQVVPTRKTDLSDLHVFLLQSMDPEDLSAAILRISKEPFDLSSELPLRIVCAHDKGKINLGFIFHSICFDLKSISLFFHEFKTVALAKMKGINLGSGDTVNTPVEIKSALLSEMDALQSFWAARVNAKTIVSLISFSSEAVKPDIICGYHTKESRKVSPKLRRGIEGLLVKWNITIFQFITSSYQILLHLLTGEPTVSLKTAVDTRSHLPMLHDIIARCVNGIPLIATFTENQSVSSFYISNSTEIMQCVDKGIYPTTLITKDTCDETAFNLVRHAIVEEDIANLVSTSKGLDEYEFTFKSKGPLNLNHETRLLIWKEKENITLQLDYLPDIVSSVAAGGILDSLIALVEYVLSEPSCLIESIPTNFISTTAQTVPVLYPTYSNRDEGVLLHMDSPEPFVGTMDPETEVEDTSNNLSQEAEQTSPENATDASNTLTTENANLTLQLNKVLSGPILKLKPGSHMTFPGSVPSNGSYFMKSTKQGWDHPVYLRLEGFGNEPLLRWGKSEKSLQKNLPLYKIAEISLNSLGGEGFVFVLKTHSRRYYFKTNDGDQAKWWITKLRDTCKVTQNDNSKPFGLWDSSMLY